MQFKAVGRLSVTWRICGVGKEIRESWTAGGGVVKVDFVDILLVREGVRKARTGMAVWERT